MDVYFGFSILDMLLHIDVYIVDVINDYGTWVYLILWGVIFCETGLVVTPFLPGDSLIFVLGALAASGDVGLPAIVGVLITAAVLGNMVNYHIGRYIGPRVFHRDEVRFLNREYLNRAHAFYEKHGPITIVIARFMPIIRTFAPFVAGVARMKYHRFMVYNLVGSVSWVLVFLSGGYVFGNIPAVEKNFTLVIFGIILVSLMPAVIAALRERKKRPRRES